MSETNSNGQSTPTYEVEIPSREALLGLVQKHLKPVSFDEFVSHFKLGDERQQVGIKRRLRAMERDGQLVYTKANSYGLPDRMQLIKGRIIGHREGFGFCQPEEVVMISLFLITKCTRYFMVTWYWLKCQAKIAKENVKVVW